MKVSKLIYTYKLLWTNKLITNPKSLPGDLDMKIKMVKFIVLDPELLMNLTSSIMKMIKWKKKTNKIFLVKKLVKNNNNNYKLNFIY